MSYRTFKRLLGETNLERKCRFLFGAGLLLLIAGSFYFYGRLTAGIVYDQNRTTGRLLIGRILYEKHWTSEPGPQFEAHLETMIRDLKPAGLENYAWSLHKADLTAGDAGSRPNDPAGYAALARFVKGEEEYSRFLHDEDKYEYFAAVRASESCLRCHHHENAEVGQLIGMARVSFPLESTKRALAWNNAILLATAIATAFLAMLASYAIVRYVVVKPVLHLKDVSDAIAHGNLDLRADIRTGDEFEELSHAFNRMLRHLVHVQEELQKVNANLDSKVDEMAKLNYGLYVMNNLKSDFLATMTHELRTPLNSILGFSDVLIDAPNLDERQRRYVRNIQTSGRGLLQLINDILDLAKIDAGKMEVHVAEFSLADLIEQLVSSMRPMAERKNIEITCRCSPDVPVLQQDAGKLQQILYNLLSNAVKFTPEGGRVTVRTQLADPVTCTVVVADTGIGIPLEDQATIFEKFRQGNTQPGRRNALTREYAGTGLGLSIVKELTQLLGGEVSLRSELGKGSEFTVMLPVVLNPKPMFEGIGFGGADDMIKSGRIDPRLLAGSRWTPARTPPA
jgi:signal transduction histidine kinase